MTELEHNPFFVLALSPSCTRSEVERQGQLLLSMLEVGLSEAGTYRSPSAVHRRTPEAVREAMAALRDPDRRLAAELWARAPIETTEVPNADPQPKRAHLGSWPDAMRALGWKR